MGESPLIYGDAYDGVTCDFAGQFPCTQGAAGIVVEFHYRYPARPHECWRYLACCFRDDLSGRLVITGGCASGCDGRYLP